MKKISIYLFVFSFLTGCGQLGPLYLSNEKPPVYVPKPKKETKAETNSMASANHS